MKNKKKRDLTKMRTPHTYVIIFMVVIAAWLLTFIVPALSLIHI